MEQQSLFEKKPPSVEGLLFHCLPILILKIRKKKKKTENLSLVSEDKRAPPVSTDKCTPPHPTLLMIRLHLQEPARSAGS